MCTQDLSLKITNIEPSYSKDPLGGCFKLTFGADGIQYDLLFSSFIKSTFEQDENLKKYISKIDIDDFYTCSDVIKEFYSLGIPVEDWVVNYIEEVKTRISAFSALLSLFQHLKTFGDDERTH